MAKNAADLIIEKINEKQNPSVVGLDPRLSSLPAALKKAATLEFGDTVEGACAAITQFNKLIIDNIYDIVPIVKPQIAFYEIFGHAGVRAFQETVQYAQKKGMIVIGDAKRNDIGSTAAAYATAFLGETDLFESKTTTFNTDWLTVNPYLGEDGIKPFLKECDANGKGIFVLVKTSNPSSGQFQDITVGNGDKPLFMVVAEATAAQAKDLVGDSGYSAVGVVVGATYPEQAVSIREVLKSSIILVPGYGKQGGGADGVVPCFNEDGYGAVVNSSRGVIFAYSEEKYANLKEDWVSAVRQAAVDMRSDINSALKRSNKLPANW